MSANSEYVICRLCGYIRKANSTGDCPACGAKPKAFVPYKQKVSTNRLRFLKLDIHPVTVHFTVGYTVSIAVLFVISQITDELFDITIEPVLDFFVYLLPIFVLAGGITGVIDGKVRYRRLKTPYLRLKLILAVSLLPISLLLAFIHAAHNDDLVYVAGEAFFILLSTIIVSFLGLVGSRLVAPIVPRGTEIKKE